ncbi:4-coumarate--CoA ligase 1-like [Ixodes scapularis]
MVRARIEDGIVYSPFPEHPPAEISMFEAVRRSLIKHGDKTALIIDDEKITHTEMLSMFRRFAAGFQRQGVRPADRVFVHIENSVESFIALYSVIFAGGVVILSDPQLTMDEILLRMKHGNASHVLSSSKDCHKFKKIKEEMNLKKIFVVGKSEGCTSVSESTTLNEDEFQEVPLTNVKKELAALTYTSGTTGISKVVEATQYSFVTALEPSRLDITFDETDVIATWGQLTFSFGFRYFLSIVCSGSTAVVLSRDTPVQKMVDTLRKHEVTTLSGPVVVLQQLVKELERTSARLDSVTKVEAYGVLLSKQVAREILSAFNLKGFRNPYGATEGGGMICTTLKNRIACDTIGFPVPMTQIKVVDTETGRVLGPGEKGQLYIRSPALLASNRNNPDSTSVVFTTDGWMLSGDIGYYDDAGQFYIVERMKDSFKCMGRQVLPTDIEAVLLSHADVAEAAVAGVPHDQYNEVAKAFVVLKPASQNKAIRATENDLQDFVADRVPIYKRLYGGVVFHDSLPKTGTGKIQKQILKGTA